MCGRSSPYGRMMHADYVGIATNHYGQHCARQMLVQLTAYFWFHAEADWCYPSLVRFMYQTDSTWCKLVSQCVMSNQLLHHVPQDERRYFSVCVPSCCTV
mmetsp:Transcript_5408/g.11933  ORF Transcript_5408/g.11933 Transcript_5408/m.11933 type:complete len:100 (+) Transcript_5408:322-621(+)